MAIVLTGCASRNTPEEKTLKEAFDGKFLVGVALNKNQIDAADTLGAAVAKRHFNSIVAENVMKCEEIHPEENRYNWEDADKFVNFGEENGMFIIGHCLIWHSQCAPWFCRDANGELVSADTLRKHMRDHIHTIVGRYKGRVKGWDVVNEAIMEDGAYRESDFYRILGPEFIPLALQYAHEADPDAELYLNDYAMNAPGKRDKYVSLAKELKEKGLRIDGIGMQSHMGLDYPDLGEYEKALKAFGTTGCNVMITELDMSALPTVNTGANVSDTAEYQQALNPYPDGLPEEVARQWNARMDSVMQIYLNNADLITRVTAWGVSDGDSWKNDWPIPGRCEYPLLFGRDHQPKPFLKKYLSRQ